MAPRKLILDYIQEHEAAQPGRIFLSQPVGGGQVVDYTWGQVVGQARRMAAHLQATGLGPGDHVAILTRNCAHFFIAELAIWMAGCTTIAIFPTESAATVGFVLRHSDARLLFIGKLDAWEQQKAGVPDGLPCIALPLAPPTPHPQWDALVGATPPLAGRLQRQPGDLAMLIYTSGSTGEPKGVMLDFQAISAAAGGQLRELERQMGPLEEWRALSYLPLAHSFERAVLACTAWVSGRGHIYFAESLDTFVQDIQRARPTFFVSVPRLWLKFQQGVLARMPARRLALLQALPVIGRVVNRRILAGLGLDQVRLAGSGSAPIAAELIDWYRRLGLNLMEGYGMSEDFTYSHCSTPEHHAPGYVGVPYDDVQVRISPDGEVLVKSPGRMVGYYKRPDLDAQSFTEDGFFHTGDRGERRADGLLRLTGRMKELFKTAKGKYVAPAPIETRLLEHPMVELAMVSGVGQPTPYALVVLAEGWRAPAAGPRPAGGAERRATVEQAMAQLRDRVNAALPTHERLALLALSEQPWSIENGCLTPTMKIRRSRIEALVQPQVQGWYAAGRPVVWGDAEPSHAGAASAS